MRSYLSLIPLSAGAHRKRDRMTLICISIAVFLVTAIFSLAEAGTRMETGRLLEKHGAAALWELFQRPAALNYFLLAGALFLLILLAGVLMISGSINSSVAQRTQFFGMLRCLGMSKRQVSRYVTLEALYWCKKAIPAGLISGTLVSWVLCGVLRYIVGEEFSGIPVFSFSFIGVFCGVLVGVMAVLLAARSPAQRAAATAPVTAMSDPTGSAAGIGQVWETDKTPISLTLGVRHALEIKKNFFLISASYALSIIIFLLFSVGTDLVGYMMPQPSNAAQLEIYSDDGSNSIDPSMLELISDMDGIERVFGRRSLLSPPSDTASPDIISFDDFDLACLEKDGMLTKGSNLDLVFGEENYVLAVSPENQALMLGDTITLNGQKLHIAGTLKYDPFSSDGIAAKATVICSGATFTRLTGISDYSLVMIKTSADISDAQIEAICEMLGSGCHLNDLRDSSTANTYIAFLFFVYSFLAIIALVTMLSIMNSVSMSVLAKMKRYGVMRALGMDGRQILSMVAAEAATYALSGSVVGCVAGLAGSKWLYTALISSHYSFALWSFPTGSLLLILVAVLLSVTAAVYFPVRRIMSITITASIKEL